MLFCRQLWLISFHDKTRVTHNSAWHVCDSCVSAARLIPRRPRVHNSRGSCISGISVRVVSCLQIHIRNIHLRWFRLWLDTLTNTFNVEPPPPAGLLLLVSQSVSFTKWPHCWRLWLVIRSPRCCDCCTESHWRYSGDVELFSQKIFLHHHGATVSVTPRLRGVLDVVIVDIIRYY